MGGIARVPVAIALGSNLGDRDEQLDQAEERLAVLLSGAVASARYETESVGGPPNAPSFLNEVVVGTTLLGPRSLLEALQAIEEAAGRERPFVNAPRTLDLDLILYGDFVIDEPGLRVPHPRFRDRVFVLQPLAEVAGDWVDPVSGRSVSDLLHELPPI
ncbi:2-amino-4-hydroxy-6- hydroxymethyldihydropteridine pyrophosphokinase [Luteitalea pratensis]|uniref:2-amino-4-hydroxy-6-hydroxymethyldihydropteridine pyrophosphokinase n=1 Tax=Luteitalea pratensis TaxID=1855912 RepID=A0A143PQZ1_LUTPR|nr:2-amino-4-hydroxy-6-hydroxymethyldihydropteridine diphosphokinase [Luteitalea pratensis]AMY11032.1 2-amino-4-hydroxy-6- hydroxymethyldihydropteridine pyrophosphokinase [Luteitalea pratensis]